MLDSIFIGMSGLTAYADGLRVISNNAANLDTPGFKGSSLQFGDMFYTQAGTDGSLDGQRGFGVDTFGTNLDFSAGDMQQTGNNLDLAIDGQGLFTLRDSDGQLRYTRDGQFTFNADGVLVDTTNNDTVVAVDGTGAQGTITMNGMRSNPAKPTSTVTFNGNIEQTQATVNIGSINVLDASGASHTLSMVLTSTQAATGVKWAVVVSDGTTQVATGELDFLPDGSIDPSADKITFNYQASGEPQQPLTLDFSSDVTSTSMGSTSSLNMVKQDGWAAGALTGTTFDSTGTAIYAYSNGQTVKGNRLQLANFDSTEAVTSDGGNTFGAANPSQWFTGTAGDQGFGAIQSGVVEASNVDLSQEFSELVIVQRGYQASSEIVSTANDMLQQLFSMSEDK